MAVDHRPGGLRPHDRLAVRIAEREMSVEPRAGGTLADFGDAFDAVALADVAAVIDLVPRHDPGVSLDMRRIGVAHPVRGGEVLHPPYPDRVVDVPVLVDVLGRRGEGQGEGVAHRELTDPRPSARG